ncbi:unnamed protein product [Plutella xylostella]|uniref:(diamondback moth) hypothetical protein n=1 Tax=Plutella xylostella TaxID=51655 RepID=A0A8S4GA92_PLUXY|nr:unnamed protein product [Plutella xylostella]
MDEIQHQHSPELEPLEAASPLRLPPLRHRSCVGSRTCYKAPLRVFRLMVFLILLPTIFLLVPLYMRPGRIASRLQTPAPFIVDIRPPQATSDTMVSMACRPVTRYRVFSSQMYPMGMTDMRLIDGKVSTTWCQRQVVKSNTTFNAFVVPSSPELSSALVNVSMTRHMELQADMKEYWGFYLLHGSTVTVSACVSWPGASLIMIRGYKHLQECAYIGDDSSEEVDELIKAEELGLLTKDDLVTKLAQLKKLDGRANQPDNMKRHKAGVSFHDPSHAENVTSSDPVPSDDITDHDPKELREILDHLHAVRQAIKDKATAEFRLPAHLVAVAAMHRFRDTNVDRDEQQWLTFKDKATAEFRLPAHLVAVAAMHRFRDTNVDRDEQQWLTFKVRQAIKAAATAEFRLPAHLVAVAAMHRFRDTNVDRDEQQWLTFKDKATAEFRLPAHLVAVAAMHRFRDTNVDRDEQQWLTFKDLDKHNKSYENAGDMKTEVESKEPIYSDKDRTTGIPRSHENLTAINQENVQPISDKNSANSEKLNKTIGLTTTERIEKSYKETELKATNRNKINETGVESIHTQEDLQRLEKEAETKTLQDEVKRARPRLQRDIRGCAQEAPVTREQGQRVLRRLQKSMGIKEETTNSIEGSAIMDKVVGSSEELDRLRRVLVEAIDEERTKAKEKKTSADSQGRSRRELVLGAPTLEQTLNEDDEARDYAGEEGLEPDGFAEHHTVVNETSPLDMSNSEFWSSFSSSEEALLECDGLILNLPLTPDCTFLFCIFVGLSVPPRLITFEEALLECDGLILNLPLTPHTRCAAGASEAERLAAAQRNAITYRVPANGYYFFVFNSENEVQTNFINVRFDLQKTRYDVARTALRECRNSTERCDLKLDMFSSQKVVLELPLRNNDSLWNEQFVVISECEPRTSIYLVCAISVPLLILVFAFQ